MASLQSIPVIDAKSSIERTGLYLVKDRVEQTNDAEGQRDVARSAGKGKGFARFFREGYYTKTPKGLDFVYQNTKGDIEIWSIVLSIIERPRWGYLRYYSFRLSSEYAWFFHNRDEKRDHEAIHTLMVQFWLPGSRITFYKGSQLLFFNAKEDPDNWGVLKTPRSNMKRKGVVATVEDMPNGGYTIIDSRLGWTCEAGGFMNIGLGDDREVAEWIKMQLPDTKPLRAKVDELESLGFRTNFTFERFLP